MKQNVIVTKNGQPVKVQFEHCPQCEYYDDCYPFKFGRVEGPNYLDPDCTEGLQV